jgi:hypothetical protein
VDNDEPGLVVVQKIRKSGLKKLFMLFQRGGFSVSG